MGPTASVHDRLLSGISTSPRAYIPNIPTRGRTVWDLVDIKATEDTRAQHSADFHFDRRLT
jgi:hypothetical protein